MPSPVSRAVVDQVREALAAGITRPLAAVRFGLSETTVRNIALGRIVGTPMAPADEAETWTALCMDPDEWEGWLAANRRAPNQVDQARRPCADCTLGFAAEMRAEGRCNGEPEDVAEEVA